MISWSTSSDFLPLAMTLLVGSFGLTSLTLLYCYDICREMGWSSVFTNSHWQFHLRDWFIILVATFVGFIVLMVIFASRHLIIEFQLICLDVFGLLNCWQFVCISSTLTSSCFCLGLLFQLTCLSVCCTIEVWQFRKKRGSCIDLHFFPRRW